MYIRHHYAARMVLTIAVAPGFLNQTKKVEIRAQRRTLLLVQHHSPHSFLFNLVPTSYISHKRTIPDYEKGTWTSQVLS